MRTRGAADLGALLTRYVEELRVRRYSASSLEKADFELPRLIHHLGENGVRDARAVTEAHLAAYARHLERRMTRWGTPLGASSRASALEHGASLLRLPREPRAPAPRSGPGDPSPEVRATPARDPHRGQARRLVAAPFPGSRIGKRDRAILETLYGTGIRLGEAARADVSDLDLRGGESSSSAAARARRIASCPCRAAPPRPRHLPHRGASRAREAPDAALFLSRHGGRLSLVGLRAIVQRHGRAIGVAVSPHALRHTCATHLLRGGADIRHVQELLGHRCLATTALYTRVAIKDLRQVLARAHPRR